MKPLFFSILFLTFSLSSYAQKWESFATLNSGFFHFVGEGANNNANSFNAYGTKSGVSYGVGIDLKRVNSHPFRVGLNVDFESLQSKAPFKFKDLNNINWEGRTFLRHNFITLNPYLSYNWRISLVSMSLQGGIGTALKIGPAKENYKAVSENGETDPYRVDRSSTAFDLRPSFQLNAFKNNIGFGIGYSAGMMDYKLGWVGGTNLVFSRYLKLSLQYRLNK